MATITITTIIYGGQKYAIWPTSPSPPSYMVAKNMLYGHHHHHHHHIWWPKICYMANITITTIIYGGQKYAIWPPSPSPPSYMVAKNVLYGQHHHHHHHIWWPKICYMATITITTIIYGGQKCA